MGFGKHDFHHIDPSTINVEDYAQNLRGEEQHFGEVRQYNSAFNEKHPENDTDLDWLGRLGTAFETDAEGHAGTWTVTNMPVVKNPTVFCRATRTVDGNLEGPEQVISCVDLGCAVDNTNQFKQVRTKLLQKGKVDRTQRERLTKKRS
jgi:hypothetical protein